MTTTTLTPAITVPSLVVMAPIPRTTGGGRETVSRTVAIASTLSRAAIQAVIDAIGREILPGVTVTVSFAEGTYVFDEALTFDDFFGQGTLVIRGVTAWTGAGDPATRVDATLGGVEVNNCACRVEVRYLYVVLAGAYDGILANASRDVLVDYCAVEGVGATSGNGVTSSRSAVTLSNARLYKLDYGIKVTDRGFLTADTVTPANVTHLIGNSFRVEGGGMALEQTSSGIGNPSVATGGVFRAYDSDGLIN